MRYRSKDVVKLVRVVEMGQGLNIYYLICNSYLGVLSLWKSSFLFR